MATVSDIFAELRAAHRRGTSLDDALPNAFRNALEFLESNYNMTRMKKTWTRQVLAGATTLALNDEATTKIKSIAKVGYQAGTAGVWNWLDQVDPGDFTSAEGPVPQGFILTSTPTGWLMTFDASWEEPTTLTFWTYNYTVWNGDTSVSDIWAVNHARTALVNKALAYLAVIMRDVTLAKMCNELWLEAQTTMLQADGEFQQGAR